MTDSGDVPDAGDAAAAGDPADAGGAADGDPAGDGDDETAGLYRLERREVELGASSVSDVEVTSGVEEGELVVVGSLSLLRDGLLVTLERDEPPAREDAAAGAPSGEGRGDEQ